MDESLGMRDGKESNKSQSYKSRRDESKGMSRAMDKRAPHRADYHMKGFEIKDNAQAPIVRDINTNSEQYDLGRVRKYSNGSRGYPAEAWNYDY
jgi:hypothetical protein